MSTNATTRWSLILAARGTDRDARLALEQLCSAYRPVVLAWFRRQGGAEPPEDATQAFFVHFLEHELHARADAARGSFRAFLYAALRNHLRMGLREAAAAKRPRPASHADASFDEACDPKGDPERAFDRDWALQVLQRARDALAREAARAGKARQFEALQPFLIEPPDPSDYALIGATLAMAPNTVAVAVRRLRERLRALVRRELADTLPPGGDLDAELRWLKQALHAPD